jgi:DNA gyrase subunit A
MGRSAAGVRGIRLKSKDEVVGMDVIENGETNGYKIVIVMKNGFGKKTPLKAYKVQGRGGSGVKTAKITEKTGAIVSTFVEDETNKDKDIIIISEGAQVIRLALNAIPTIGRDTQGVRLMRFKLNDDKVASVTTI